MRIECVGNVHNVDDGLSTMTAAPADGFCVCECECIWR